jgi:hypothetical protein
MDIDAVHEPPEISGNVALDHRGARQAVARAVVVESAGLRVLSLLKSNSFHCGLSNTAKTQELRLGCLTFVNPDV